MGLGRLVDIEKGSFIGQAPLVDERARGPQRKIVGLEVNWTEVEVLYERYELLRCAGRGVRSAVPVMSGDGRWGVRRPRRGRQRSSG